VILKKSNIYRDIAPCSPLKVNQGFGRIYCLHLQGRINREKYQPESRWHAVKLNKKKNATCFHAGIFFGLFDPEDGGDMFLPNVG
jgi:hypothetical protein